MLYLPENADAERTFSPAAAYQRSASGISRHAVVQRYSFEDFDTYEGSATTKRRRRNASLRQRYRG